MINIAISYPSEIPGAVLDVKKGRSTISFTRADLQFLADIFETIEMNDIEEEDEHESGLLVENTEKPYPGQIIEVD